VLSGAGETTCANSRCKYHEPPPGPPSTSDRKWDDDGGDSAHSGMREKREMKLKKKPLATLELPFSYQEDGEAKSALVKVVLCERCVKKLNYKREHDKQQRNASHVQDDTTPQTSQLIEQTGQLKRSRSRSPEHTANDKKNRYATHSDRGLCRTSRSAQTFNRDHDIREQWIG
jgi:protein FRA10AC1